MKTELFLRSHPDNELFCCFCAGDVLALLLFTFVCIVTWKLFGNTHLVNAVRIYITINYCAITLLID